MLILILNENLLKKLKISIIITVKCIIDLKDVIQIRKKMIEIHYYLVTKIIKQKNLILCLNYNL